MKKEEARTKEEDRKITRMMMANLKGKPTKKRKGPPLEEAQEEASAIKKDLDS